MWTTLLLRGPDTSPIDVSAARASRTGSEHRVTARVAGQPVWFASSDLPLAAANEALGAALLVPALHAGRPLRLAGSTCDTWATNLSRLTDGYRQLWYPEAPRPLPLPHATPDQTHPAQGTALCFSGGVDAFHTLLTCPAADTLVYVAGYDVPVRNQARVAHVSTLIRAVAQATGRRAVVIATNLRRHPLLRATPWLRAFAGPLAAVGHLLREDVGRILLSSDGLGFEHPEVGSRPSLDPLHSSAHLQVEHVSGCVTRLEKIAAIASEPLVQRHLRVCWKNVGTKPNCGRCEKCIRTMLALDACDTLDRFPSFDHGRGLTAAIDALPSIEPVVQPFYRDLLDRGLSTQAAAAVTRLLDRSRHNEPEHTPTGSAQHPASPPAHPAHDTILPVARSASARSIGCFRQLPLPMFVSHSSASGSDMCGRWATSATT